MFGKGSRKGAPPWSPRNHLKSNTETNHENQHLKYHSKTDDEKHRNKLKMLQNGTEIDATNHQQSKPKQVSTQIKESILIHVFLMCKKMQNTF